MILNCLFEICYNGYNTYVSFFILELKRDGPPPCIGICYTMKLEALKQREELTKHNEVLKEVRFQSIHRKPTKSTVCPKDTVDTSNISTICL